MTLIIDAQGDGYKLGTAHGETARSQIANALERWMDATLKGTAETSAMAYASRFLDGTDLLDAMQRHTPDLYAEIEGIAEGAGQPFELIAAYNLMDEQWWFDLGLGLIEPGCSVIAVDGDDGLIMCQNMDLPGFMDGSQVVLRLRPDHGPEQIVLSSAGLIGLTGLNAAGVGICVNTLLMLNPAAAGLPVAAVFRRALAQPTRRKVTEFLDTTPHASGQHYVVADDTGLASRECSADGSATVPIRDGILLHTNHPLVSDDINGTLQDILEKQGRISNSCARLDHLTHLRKGRNSVFSQTASDGFPDRLADVAALKAILDDPDTPICVTPGEGRPGFTFGSVVFVPGKAPQAHIRAGFPGLTEWKHICFSAS